MGLSILEFPYTGNNDFDLNFSGGYASRDDIQSYVGGTNPFSLNFDWLTNSRVRIDPVGVSVGDTVVFTRTVSKENLPVDLTALGSLNRESVQTAVQHTLFAMHEFLDGRYGDVAALDDIVFNSVNTAVANALSSFLAQSSTKVDLVLHPTFSGPAIETYTSGGQSCPADSVLVFVDQPPAVTTEYLVENNGTVVFSVTIDNTGAEVARSNTDILTTAGSVSTDVTGGNYVSGVDLHIVMPLISVGVVDFGITPADYLAIYTEARDT